MTEAQKARYAKIKDRFRSIGVENPADVILALDEEIEQDIATIKAMEDELDKYRNSISLLEKDVADWRKLAESKVEEIHPEFMRDYKCMEEELEGVYEELAELRGKLEEAKR